MDLEDLLNYETLKTKTYWCNWTPKTFPKTNREYTVKPPYDPGNTKVYFGKHKGKKLSAILKEDRRYLEWFVDNVKFKELIEDIKLLLK